MDDLNEDRIALIREVVAQHRPSKGIPVSTLTGRAQSVLEEAGTVSAGRGIEGIWPGLRATNFATNLNNTVQVTSTNATSARRLERQTIIGAMAQRVSRPPRENVKETIESILVAFILAFIFRAFVVEAFVIPTGSMAPTLLGAHMRYRCEDCGYKFDVNFSGKLPFTVATDPSHYPTFDNTAATTTATALLRMNRRIITGVRLCLPANVHRRTPSSS